MDIVIPSYIQDKPVVAVEGLFGSGDHYINSIAIPGTVKRLGDYGLSYMIITEPLTIPAGVQQIGEYCFYGFRVPSRSKRAARSSA